MRLSVERLRWGLLAGALLLVGVVVVLLSYGRYRAVQAWKQILARSGATITHETNGVTYSQALRGKTIFTLHAKRAIPHGEGQVHAGRRHAGAVWAEWTADGPDLGSAASSTTRSRAWRMRRARWIWISSRRRALTGGSKTSGAGGVQAEDCAGDSCADERADVCEEAGRGGDGPGCGDRLRGHAWACEGGGVRHGAERGASAGGCAGGGDAARDGGDADGDEGGSGPGRRM